MAVRAGARPGCDIQLPPSPTMSPRLALGCGLLCFLLLAAALQVGWPPAFPAELVLRLGTAGVPGSQKIYKLKLLHIDCSSVAMPHTRLIKRILAAATHCMFVNLVHNGSYQACAHCEVAHEMLR